MILVPDKFFYFCHPNQNSVASLNLTNATFTALKKNKTKNFHDYFPKLLTESLPAVAAAAAGEFFVVDDRNLQVFYRRDICRSLSRHKAS